MDRRCIPRACRAGNVWREVGSVPETYMSPLEATVPLDPCPLWTQPPLDGPLTMVKVTRASGGPIASGKSPPPAPPPPCRDYSSLLAVISSHRWEIGEKHRLSRFLVSEFSTCSTRYFIPVLRFLLSNFIIVIFLNDAYTLTI